jgi:hypothetical protein
MLLNIQGATIRIGLVDDDSFHDDDDDDDDDDNLGRNSGGVHTF